MPENTFEFNGATVTVRRETVRDRLAIDVLLHDLDEALGKTQALEEYHQRRQFAHFVKLSDVQGDIGFDLRGPVAETFDGWLNADAELYEAWVEAAVGSKKTK
jgi:hypothetical protein